jgi:hypothetical protein
MYLCRICNRYAISVNAEGKCRRCASRDRDRRRAEICNRKLHGVNRILIGDIA